MKKKTLAFAVLATMLASCASNDEPAVVTEDNAPITVTAGVNELETRAGHDSDNLPAKFYLSITQDTEDADSKYNYSNVELKKASLTNDYSAPEGTFLLWADNGDHTSATITAYTVEGTDITVQTDQTKTTDGLINSDLLGAVSSDVTISGDNISIAFRHLLCKLDVTFSWGTEITEGAQSYAITGVTYSGFGTDATLNRTTAGITNGSNTGDILAYLSDALKSEAIFAPQVESPKIIITTEIDSAVRTFALNVTAPEGGFASGSCYQMTVTLGGTAATVSSATISNGWGTGTGDNFATE